MVNAVTVKLNRPKRTLPVMRLTRTQAENLSGSTDTLMGNCMKFTGV